MYGNNRFSFKLKNKKHKKFTILILFATSVTCFSQAPDPDLFQAWYLRSFQATDIDTYYEVSSIQPSISPTWTIIDDINFTGEGACNTFSGVFAFLNANNMQIDQFTPTTNALLKKLTELLKWEMEIFFVYKLNVLLSVHSGIVDKYHS